MLTFIFDFTYFIDVKLVIRELKKKIARLMTLE